MHSLRSKLNRIDKNSYKLYKNIQGSYDFGEYKLTIDHVQADPFAPPSKITIAIKLTKTQFPKKLYDNSNKSKGFRDALARVVAKTIRRLTKSNRGTGNSGVFVITYGKQKILERNSIVIQGDELIVRLMVGLPAFGRRVAAIQATEMFFDELPAVIDECFYWAKLDSRYFNSFVHLIEKQEFIRKQLSAKKLICFIADAAILPRKSGVEDTPLQQDVVKFKSPKSLQVSMDLPDGSTITGMGVPQGVILITGGGFHGKSTLLNAIQTGIYNHIPGDGREFVVSSRDIVKVRAEDGRNVANVNISTFINNLPNGKSGVNFCTDNASGSTSQATNIMEAIEMGATTILMDEDSSAMNFLIRDKRMRKLIPSDKEPITPYIDMAQQLYNEIGLSTILVVGGSGDYIDVADTVIMLEDYKVLDVTDKAKAIAEKYRYTDIHQTGGHIAISHRIPLPKSISASKGKREAKISVFDTGIIFGRNRIELSAWEHIDDRTQYNTIGDILYYALKCGYIDGKTKILDVMNKVLSDIEAYGLDVIWQKTPQRGWNYYCEVRAVDIAAALNRLRTLQA